MTPGTSQPESATELQVARIVDGELIAEQADRLPDRR